MQPRGDLAQEMLGQRRHIAVALAQWRQPHIQRVEAILQVAAKDPGRHPCFQAGIGGGDDAHVRYANRAPTDRAVLVVLQEPEQRDLAFARERVDLVEKQRATARAVDQAALGALGVGEGTTIMSEQLVLDQAVGKRAAVDRYERVIAAGAGVMDLARRQFLAGAGFALDQHLHVATGVTPQARAHQFHRLRLPEHDRHHPSPRSAPEDWCRTIGHNGFPPRDSRPTPP